MRFYENILKTHENRLPPRSYYIPSGESEYQLLNGTWKFAYFSRDVDLPDRIEQWDEIPVPSCWQNLGYENPNYSNMQYTFPLDPPYAPDDNPCGVYERTFALDSVWGRVYFVMEGVSSCGEVFVNGRRIGFTEGSHLQAEFDITDAVRAGENTLRVIVRKWCVGSYLEDQDMFRANGIFRDCYLLQRPLDHIVGVSLKTDGNRIIADNDQPATVSLYDGDVLLATAENATHSVFTVENHVEWNAEKPYLYTVKWERNGEVITRRVGFRTITISDKYELLINGVAVKLHGVNHHDTHPKNGWVQTNEELLRDLRLMKSLNINCIRTSHYPPTPWFIDKCDEMGFYVVLENDMETHGFIYREGNRPYRYDTESPDWPCVMPDWEGEIVGRMQRTAATFSNNTSVIMWSIGNESGHGPNHEAMMNWLHSLKDGRLVHSCDATMKKALAYTDVCSWMYLSFSTLRDYLEDESYDQPIFLCEYTHAMGNGPGDVFEYNEIFDAYPKAIGGCVWEWADHTVEVDGVKRYGGDFEGEITHDGNFCCDGMVFADRTLKAGSLEVKAAYQPMRTRLENDTLYVYNRLDFTNLNEYELVYCVEVDGNTTDKQTLRLDVAPHTEIAVPLSLTRVPCQKGAFVTCRLFKDGNEVAVTQHPLPWMVIPKTCLAPAPYTEDERYVYFAGDAFRYVFSKHEASFVSMMVNGEEKLAAPPVLSAWRAPTDNDRHIKALWGHENNWQGENFDRVFHKTYDVTLNDGIETAESLAGISRKPFVHYGTTYRVYTDGTIDVTVSGTIRENCVFLPRLGMEYTLPLRDGRFTYFGRGPHECYSDMCHASTVGQYTSTADAEYVPYIRPQEHGNHIDTRELCVGGLTFTALGEQPFEFQVSRYSKEALTKADHTDELTADGNLHVRIDYKVSGIGSQSCGPALEPPYQLNEKEFTYGYRIHVS